MRARILCTAVVLCLLPNVGAAQDGLRSAALPERPLISPGARPRIDVFRARPDTYIPRRDRPNIYELPTVFLGPYWYFGDMYSTLPSYGYVPCAGVVRGCPVVSYDDRDRRERHRAHRYEQAEPVPRSGPADIPPPPYVSAPGRPKTFYVIAGCYAGDKPPQREWLPPGCDLSRARAVGP